MAFNFGTTKSATGFTLPTATSATSGGTFTVANPGAGGDLGTAKPSTLFGTPASSAAVPANTGTLNFGFGTSAPTAATATSASTGFPFGGAAASTAAPSSTGFAFGGALTATTAPSSGFSLGSTTLSIGATPATISATPLSFGTLGGTTTTSTVAPSFSFGPSTAASTSALPATGSLTFSQLEDAINKWTVDLEEQGKVFANQAKHLNAWDRLLMTNGEKILSVSNGVERIKQQQQQLDQELDFVLAQQKELEECIIPLEKEYKDVPVTDVDRDQTYKLAENIDAQLKQMSEDLKEIIEHLNESNKAQELSDPVAQIGRILNAHMNSLQWIDRSTSQISVHLDEIAKMHEINRRNNENIHGA